MEQKLNPNIVPPGPGGTLGHVLRMIATLCTGGFAFPNSFVEGIDCTAIQQQTQGDLYDKKP